MLFIIYFILILFKKNGNLCLNDVLEMSERCLTILMWFVLFLECNRMYMFSFIFLFLFLSFCSK